MLRISSRILSGSNVLLIKNNPRVLFVSNRWRTKKQKTVDTANVTFLMKLLGVEYETAVDIFTHSKYRKKFFHDDIVANHAYCVKHGIIDMVVTKLPNYLFCKPNILEQRITFCKDIGCSEIPLGLLTSLRTNLETSVKDLKERQLLPEDADVTKNLLNSSREESLPSLESIPDDHTLGDIHEKVLSHYLRWKLEPTEIQLKRIMETKCLLKAQSLSILVAMVNTLMNELGFSREKILRNRYLLLKSPAYINELVEELNRIQISKTKPIIMKFPKIIRFSVPNFKEKLDTLKKFNVPDFMINQYPQIFILSNRTLQKRLVEFQTMTELQSYWNHPRALGLICNLEIVKERFVTLKELNVRCPSLQLLWSNKFVFARHMLVGMDRTKGIDLMQFLCSKFDVESKDHRLLLIKRHPMWCQIPFPQIFGTFDYLKKLKFTDQDILENIHIVLYHRKKVERELKNMDSMGLDPSWKITRSRKLALCLYGIEKVYHFDNNGVWSCESEPPSSGKIVEEAPNPRSLRQTSTV